MAATGTTSTVLGGSGSTYLLLSGNITGSGNLVLANNGGNVRFSGDNSGFTGQMTVNSGASIYINTVTAGSSAAVYQIDGSLTFPNSPGTYNLGSLQGGGTLKPLGPGTAFSVGALGLSSIFSGVISNNTGTAALVKVGSGTLTLSGANTYTGGTTINDGTLLVDTTIGGSLASGTTINVALGATWDVKAAASAALGSFNVQSELTGGGLSGLPARILNGTSSIVEDITTAWRAKGSGDTGLGAMIASNVLDLGFSGAVPTYVLQMQYDPASLTGGAGREASLAAAGTINVIYNNGGTWTGAGTNFAGVGAYGSDMTAGDYGVNTSTHTVWVVLDHAAEFAVTTIPEPGTLILLAIGLLGLVMWGRRKRK